MLASREEPGVHATELGTYKPYRSHEPDGKYAAESAADTVGKDELGTYRAYRSHEPDGKYAASQEATDKPDDLGTYGAFRSHEPDGKYATPAPDAEPSSPAPGKKAAGISKYGAVRHHEFHGRPLTEPAENLTKPAGLEVHPTVQCKESSGSLGRFARVGTPAEDKLPRDAGVLDGSNRG